MPWAAQNVSHRLIRQAVTQIGQGSGFHFRSDRRSAPDTAHVSSHRTLGNEPSITGQDGVGFDDTGDRSECFASKAFPDLGESSAFGIAHRNLNGSFALRIRFSAARYSFCRRSSWFTEPVTYASHTHFLFLMPTVYLTLRRAV